MQVCHLESGNSNYCKIGDDLCSTIYFVTCMVCHNLGFLYLYYIFYNKQIAQTCVPIFTLRVF